MAELRRTLRKPYRKVRRWVRHTPNNEIAVTLSLIAFSLVFIAGGLAYYML